MIDFINEAYENNVFDNLCLYPIHVDTDIVCKIYYDFSKILFENLEHYYATKGSHYLRGNKFYSFVLRDNSNSTAPTLFGLDYSDNVFYIEFTNTETKRAILIGVSRDSAHLSMRFYSDYSYTGKNNYSKVKLVGNLALVSNVYNNGISVQLLEIFYNYMENGVFDEDNLFSKININ